MNILHHINHSGTKKESGNKAASLHKMHKLGFTVPETYVIPKHVKKAFSDNPEVVREKITHEIDEISEKDTSWAIRSSAEVEDLECQSFAGQFTTLLDVSGTHDIVDAIEKVWDSGDTVRENLYCNGTVSENGPSGMSVILQKMVTPLWSGVAFSINPVTGRNEFVIEAVQGSGVKLVQDGVRPIRWTWHQQSWDYEVEPDEDLKKVLEALVEGIKKLKKSFDKPVDIEWAYDGKELFYLQCRPITVSEFPTIFSNHISREVIPGMIKPLVWSINIPLVNGFWIRLLERLLGRLNIEPEQLSKSFFYRAYFNMGTIGTLISRLGFPKDSMENLMGRKTDSGKKSFKPGLKTIRYLPSMLGFMMSMLVLRRKFIRAYPRIVSCTDLLDEKFKRMTAADYFSCFKEIWSLASEGIHFNTLILLSCQISNRVLQKKLEKRGIPYESLDFIKDFPELSAYDPSEYLVELQHKWASLPMEIRDQIEDIETLKSSQASPQLKVISDGIEKLIAQFGHFSESGNDFSCQPWRENPDFLFTIIRQQTETSPAPKENTEKLTLKSKGIPRRAYRRAGRFRLYREMISSEYTRLYGLFRVLFLTTGRIFKDNGWLNDPADVFYLTLEQHNRMMDGINQEEEACLKQKIEEIKKEMDDYKDMILPSVIYGDIPPPIPREDEEVLEGTPTSPGLFEGELVVVKGYKDFEKNVEGKILVIPFSDVGWTPLLVRAGGIVSESGGMLSHASIIAREHSIPAISSVDHACNLRDGQSAIIDGYSGTLILSS